MRRYWVEKGFKTSMPLFEIVLSLWASGVSQRGQEGKRVDYRHLCKGLVIWGCRSQNYLFHPFLSKAAFFTPFCPHLSRGQA